MQNNFTDLINFNEMIYREAKNRDPLKENIFKHFFPDDANNEPNRKRTDIITYEALFATYMHIMGVNTLTDMRDPVALLSMHIETMYPEKKELRSDDRVHRFFVAFRHKTESFIHSAKTAYEEFMSTRYNDRMFITNKLEATTEITLNPRLSAKAKSRYDTYIRFIEGEIEEVSYMHLTKERVKFTSSEDFASGYDNNIHNRTTNSRGVSFNKVLINEIDSQYASPGIKVPKNMRERAEKFHKKANEEGRLIELLTESNIKNKQIDRKQGKMTVLDNIDLRSESLYNIGLHYSNVKQCLKLFSVKNETSNGKDSEVVILNENEPILLNKQELQILGPTGSGKSVSIEAVLFDLMKKGIKVLYVCSEVSQAVGLMKKMMHLTRINEENSLPTPYLNIGQDTFKYEVDLIIDEIKNDNIDLANSITACNVMLDPINKEVFRQLNSSCLLKDSLGFYKSNTTKGKKNKVDYKPCAELRTGPDNKSKRYCSLYSECGNFERYKVMNEASLWITTNASLFSSSIPLQWDKHKATVLETSLLHADVVIIDEADAIEADSDSRLIETIQISKEKARGAFDYDAKALLDAIRTHSTYLIKSSDSTLINRMLTNTDYAHQIDRILYTHIHKMDPVIQKHITRNFTTETLIKAWLKEYTYRTQAHPDRVKEKNGEDTSIPDLDFSVFINKAFADIDKSLKLEDHLSWVVSIEESEDFNEEFKKRIDKLIYKFLDNLKIEVDVNTNNKDEETVDNKQYKSTYTLKPVAGKEDELLDRHYLFNTILLVSKLEKLLSKGILPYIPEFKYALDAEPDSRSIEPSLQQINGVNRHAQYTPEMPIDISGFKFNEVQKSKGGRSSRFEFSMTVCFGIGRDVLRNANKCLSAIYNCRPAQIIYTSATSRAEGSSLYNIDSPVAAVIRNTNQDEQTVNINIERYIIDNLPFFLSGTKPAHLKEKLCEFTTSYLGKEGELLHIISEKQKSRKVAYNEASPITLILTNSYKQADWVGDSLAKTNWISEKDIAILYSADSSEGVKRNNHITKNELSKLYSRNVRVLVAPIESISRGFNILRGHGSDKSLISDIVFMFRPYPSPEDYLSLTSLVSSKLKGVYAEENKKAKRQGYSAYEYVKNQCEQTYSYLQDANSWIRLGELEKNSIAINQLVSKVVQAIGRGRRGGTDVNVYFVDGALCGINTAEITKDSLLNGDTMISYWIKFLNRKDSLTDCVYKKIKDGFNNLTINTHRF